MKYGTLKTGDSVTVIQPFYFYDDYYETGQSFIITEEMVLHGFERFVVLSS